MQNDIILLAHGSGGKLMRMLIDEIVKGGLANPILSALEDQASLQIGDSRIAFTTDSFVVNPIFFPGGDIGELAVYGTVNDLAVGGATPLYISLSFIIEEGFSTDELSKIVKSVAHASKRAGVEVVTGDTKVVERGHGDSIYINTSGIGLFPNNVKLSASTLQEDDAIIISGTIAEHGMAVMAKRRGLSFASTITSDCAPVNLLTMPLVKNIGEKIRAMRDPTRGGVSAVLNEWAESSNVTIEINEEVIPMRDDVKSASEMLGLDPLNVACEGRFLVAVEESAEKEAIALLKTLNGGENATTIGRVEKKGVAKVVMQTAAGGKRLVHLPTGEQLPRIC